MDTRTRVCYSGDMKPKVMRVSLHVGLALDAAQILERLASEQGQSQTAVLEALIRAAGLLGKPAAYQATYTTTGSQPASQTDTTYGLMPTGAGSRTPVSIARVGDAREVNPADEQTDANPAFTELTELRGALASHPLPEGMNSAEYVDIGEQSRAALKETTGAMPDFPVVDTQGEYWADAGLAATAIEQGADVDKVMDDFAAKYADTPLNDPIPQRKSARKTRKRKPEAQKVIDEALERQGLKPTRKGETPLSLISDPVERDRRLQAKAESEALPAQPLPLVSSVTPDRPAAPFRSFPKPGKGK